MTVFSKIIAGELPGRFVYRDASVVAFLDIAPLNYGHVLVVPVEPVDKWTDLSPQLWAKLNDVAQRVGQAIIEVFECPRAGYMIAGFDVPHAHIHVFPAHNMDDFDESRAIPADQTDPQRMDDAQRRLSEAIQRLGSAESASSCRC